MSCPFSKEHLVGLKKFIDLCKANPGVLHYPELSFFKQYVESLGGLIPDAPIPTAAEAPKTHPAPEKTSPEEPKDEIVESDVELDMAGVVPPDNDIPQKMGPEGITDVCEEAFDASNEKKREAVDFYAAGEYAKATEAYTEAIMLNPGSAMLYAKRGQTYLAQKKPNACVRDCDRAILLNPDCAAAYKFRGRARRLLGEFVKAAEDLRCACKLDFDEQADEWLKEVTPNARKLEDHRRKYERLRNEQQARQARERLARSREAHAKAQADSAAQAPPAGDSSWGFGSGGPGGMNIPPELLEILSEPEFVNGMKDPEIAAAFKDITTNPANILKHQNNPKVAAFLAKMTQKLGGVGGLGGMMGGLAGMMGGMGGPGAGAGPGSGASTGPAAPADIDID